MVKSLALICCVPKKASKNVLPIEHRYLGCGVEVTVSLQVMDADGTLRLTLTTGDVLLV